MTTRKFTCNLCGKDPCIFIAPASDHATAITCPFSGQASSAEWEPASEQSNDAVQRDEPGHMLVDGEWVRCDD